MRKKVLRQGALALLCLILVRVHRGDERPRSLPIAETFAPTDGFRTAVSQLVKVPEFMHDDCAALRMLGRRPLAFYLALEGRRLSMVASEKDLTLGPIGPDDWVLVDGVHVGEGLHEGSHWPRL